jgi:drug/metabolite transporter (DMT)-like permease
VVLWASAFVAIRSAGGYFAPGALALGRLLVASLALGVVWLLSRGGWPTRVADWHWEPVTDDLPDGLPPAALAAIRQVARNWQSANR